MTSDPREPREPAKKLGGMEYDWRPPNAARLKSRAWNSTDPRLFTPKSFGWGYGVNFYWLFHPRGWLRARGSR